MDRATAVAAVPVRRVTTAMVRGRATTMASATDRSLPTTPVPMSKEPIRRTRAVVEVATVAGAGTLVAVVAAMVVAVATVADVGKTT